MEKKSYRCEEICPFYSIFEKIHEKKEKDEVYRHLTAAKSELISALKAVIDKVTKKIEKEKAKKVKIE